MPIVLMLAIGAVVLVLVSAATATGLYLFARMAGHIAPPVKNTPDVPNDSKTDANTRPTPLTDDQKFALTYIADGFTGVVVAHPKRALASDALAGLPQEQWFETFAAFSLDPRDAEIAVAVVDPTPEGAMPVTIGGAARFAEKLNARLLKVSTKAQEAKFQDKMYYRTEPAPGASAVAYYLTDDRTIVIGSEPMLKKMISAKDVKSPLAERLRTADLSDDVTAILVVEPMRDTARTVVQDFFKSAPPDLVAGAALADQLNAATLTADLTKDPLIRVDAEAKDDKTAGDVLKFVNVVRDQLKQHYDDVKGGLLNGAPPDAPDLIDRFSSQLQKGFTAKAEGPHVRLSANRPAATKEAIAKLAPSAAQMFDAKPIPEPQPNPLRDIHDLGVEWVRGNNAFGPNHEIVDDTAKKLDDQVEAGQGFVATFGATLVKSRKPTMLVGWNGDVFPLELTAEQGKQAKVQDAEMAVQAVPAGDDLGPTEAVGRLSALKIDHADALDGAAKMTGRVQFHRLRPDDANEYYSLRLMILGPKTRSTVYQHFRTALPKGDGPLSLDFPSLGDNKLGVTTPVPVLVEVIAYLDPARQFKPIVVSNAVAELIVPAK
jgi:hypothetical protein